MIDNPLFNVYIELLAGQFKKKAIKDDKNENKHEHKKKILSLADTDLVTPVCVGTETKHKSSDHWRIHIVNY